MDISFFNTRKDRHALQADPAASQCNCVGYLLGLNVVVNLVKKLGCASPIGSSVLGLLLGLLTWFIARLLYISPQK
jgi:hypothetical protein